jgi:hypothetical protein
MERNDAGNTDFLISISPFHVTVKSTKTDNESHDDTTRLGWSFTGWYWRESFFPESGKLFSWAGFAHFEFWFLVPI